MLELVNILFKKKSYFYLGWTYLMMILLNWYLLLAQPYLCCKCYDLLLLYAHLHLLRVLDDFGGVRIPYLCTPIVHEHWGASLFLFRTLVLDLLDCFSPLWRCLE